MTATTTDLLSADAETVLAAALEHNDGYLEHEPAVLAAGRPEIRVTVCTDRRGGDRLRCIITPAVTIDETGGHYEAAEPIVKWIRWFDGRLAPREQARRARRYLGLADARIPVIFRDGRR